jgi:tripartite-type tricarboxylate transporter receptor subunit TctC
MPYDPARAFAPVSLVGRSPNFLIVATQSSFGSVEDLIAAAKAKPGQVSFGSQGNGTTPHLTGALFALRAGADFVHVPYRGFPPAIADLVTGRIAFMFADSGNTLPRVRNQQVRVLAVASSERWALLPEVKTMSELGYPDFVSAVYYALAAPAKTPTPIVDRIREDVARAVKAPDAAERLQQLGVEILASTPEEMRNVLRAETARWDEVIRKTGVKAD